MLGRNNFGAFLLCQIQYILINRNFDNLFFVGHIFTIIYNNIIIIIFDDDTRLFYEQYSNNELVLVSFQQLLFPEVVLKNVCNGHCAYALESAPLETF